MKRGPPRPTRTHTLCTYTPLCRSAGAAATALPAYADTARAAATAGLGVNAGHDLSQANLGAFLDAVPNVLEVSIGHALIGEALYEGLDAPVRPYLSPLACASVRPGPGCPPHPISSHRADVLWG